MSQTNREKLDALSQQKAALKTELADLKREQGRSRFDGVPFEKKDRLSAIAAEIDEIDEAIVLAQKYVDAEEARELALHQAASMEHKIELLEKERAEYLAAVAEIEKAAELMASGFGRVHAVMPRLNSIAMDITGQNNLPLFQHANYLHRLLGRFSQITADVVPPLGAYAMARADAEKLLPSWVAEEERTLSNHIGHSIVKLRRRAEQLRAEAGAATE